MILTSSALLRLPHMPKRAGHVLNRIVNLAKGAKRLLEHSSPQKTRKRPKLDASDIAAVYFYIFSVSFYSILLIFCQCVLSTWFNKVLGLEFLLTRSGLHNLCRKRFCSRFGRVVTKNVTTRDVGSRWMSPMYLNNFRLRYIITQLPRRLVNKTKQNQNHM